MPYYPVKFVRGVLIFSSYLLDDTSVDVFWKIILSTYENSHPEPP